MKGTDGKVFREVLCEKVRGSIRLSLVSVNFGYNYSAQP
jgi:hypothetical protein